MQNMSRTQERWIALLLWGGLLILLLISTITIADLASRGQWINSNIWTSYFPGQQGSVIPRTTIDAIAIVQLILAIYVAANMLRAWFRFGQLSLQLSIAYSRVETEESSRTLVAHFLTLKRPTDATPGSYITDVLRPLAYAWAVTIIWPAILTLIWITR
jgi:hypothetical protein